MLRNPQLRKNVAHAIDVIQAKRGKAGGGEDGLAGTARGGRGDSGCMRWRIWARTSNNLKSGARRPGARCTGPRMRPRRGRSFLKLLREENASEVIKIKTMTSAEIQLNPFLEAAGVRTYETDLAEIILQLGEDEPSHIVVPALHVNRSQVREIFARRMGLKDLSDDPQGADARRRGIIFGRSFWIFRRRSAGRIFWWRRRGRWWWWSRRATGGCA